MIWNTPKKPQLVLVLAHGAGAGMEHPWMSRLAQELSETGIAVLRFDFPYMENKKRRPDPPNVAVAAISKAVESAIERWPKLPVFAGGKSFGGRMTTTAAAQKKLSAVRGIICFGFPLHPPNKPTVERALHLEQVTQPILFLQGTRDKLADLNLIRQVVKKNSQITLHVVEGADHGFSVLKSSGRTDSEIWTEIKDAVSDFVKSAR